MRLFVVALCLLLGTSNALPAATCHANASSTTTVSVSWARSPGVDLYYVALTSSPTPPFQPFAIQTTATTSLEVTDLLPNRSFFVTVFAHPETADLVWDWKQLTAPQPCATKQVGMARPHSVRREGTLALNTINISWNPPVEPFHHFEIGHKRMEDQAQQGWLWSLPVPKHRTRAQLTGLLPDSTYSIRVRAASTAEVNSGGFSRASDNFVARTAPTVGKFTQVYRISEYQFLPDFLDNHDSADADAIPVYIMDHNPITTASISPHWEQCAAALPSILPSMHGEGLRCLEYAAANKRDAITAACGNFSTKDDFLGWDVHWYCGTGWPESVVMSSPITEYCVHHLPAPTLPKYLAKDGFAAYTSCNGDEVDPWGNAPKKPMCICNVWMDRMISQEPRSVIEAMCGLKGGNHTAYEPFVGDEVQCNCSGVNGDPPSARDSRGGVFLSPADPSNLYPGRAPVILPYLWYVRQDADYASHPFEKYPVSVPSGWNYAWPRNGSCAESQPLGSSCKWKRAPAARVFWGADLQSASWNFSFVQDTPTDMGHTLANKKRFKQMVTEDGGADATSAAARFMTRRCCGC